jgi:hypothetical protein
LYLFEGLAFGLWNEPADEDEGEGAEPGEEQESALGVMASTRVRKN